ncbi:GAF domain-containing protein [Nocardia cyriacigeorgica]|uniref:GAF domain-containing protein n=1 Tax=Nocardia cyriacigeorgica TaxID=135487 RepID=UPI00189564B1|nr:GAF domain-containing protein [Nocardia cyriacigeorgica]MBF6415266.1 DUF5593 domain-containing protein [Nocardia cyriacigeorgica]
MIPWVTVETLAPDVQTVASVGDEARGFAGWRRVLQRILSKTPALYDSLSTRGIGEAIDAAQKLAEDVDLTIPTASGPHRLLIRPVFGPARQVHALRIWLGPGAEQVPELRPAVGVTWDLDAQMICQPNGISGLPGMVAEEYVPRVSLAEVFHRFTGFDLHAEVLSLLYGPQAGDKLQFETAVRTGSGKPAKLLITIRARVDAQARGAWLLIEDITSETTTVSAPTLEHVGLREAHRRAGTHLAVIQISHASIAHWLTDPAPWIRWDYLFRPVDVFHPDDRARLPMVAERLLAGESAGLTMRTLDYGGDYQSTSLLLHPYPGTRHRDLAIGQLVRATGERPMLDDSRYGLPVHRVRTPIGYDHQLRHWLAGRQNHSPAF